MTFNIGPVNLKRLSKYAIIPEYVYDYASCCDLSSIENYIFLPMGRKLVRTGWAMELPYGFDAQIRAKSGISIKKGLTLINGADTIDHDYRGELLIPIINLNVNKVSLKRGEKIAQLCFSHVCKTSGFREVEVLPDTLRGDGGFGSTGKSTTTEQVQVFSPVVKYKNWRI